MSGENSAKKMNAMIRDPQHYKRVLLSIQTFNENRTFTDVCFVCARGHKVYAHKLLLSTVSTLLKEIFLDMQDNLQTTIVHLPDIEARKMELIVNFLYEGSVRVNQHEYKDFQAIMDTLGIVLTPPTSNQIGGNSTQQTVQPIIQPQQQIQPPQLVYMPTTPNTQGQVQYVLAAPGQLNQAQVLQAPLMTSVVTQQPPGQVQNGAQVMQVQQGNMMQMVQQNNNQVVPLNNHVVSGSQIVSGDQLVQCSSQMVVQGNQQSIVSNNQMQVGMQNQVAQNNYVTSQTVQQQPQYVMASNQLTSNRSTTQYRQPRTQGIVRSSAAQSSAQIQHPNRMNNEDEGEHTSLVESIKSILQENSADPECLTARKIRESMEQKLDRDLAHMEEDIEFVLKSFETGDDKRALENLVPKSGPSVVKAAKSSGSKSSRKKKMPYCGKSDDETDIDFNPKTQLKKKMGKSKIKKL